ncbi:MAG TPA: hypothetical protein VLD18_04910, partial [Verrucomicrobiae bacterium]|nr:hypothetical protein [Verrucomicrobiae bacterium]
PKGDTLFDFFDQAFSGFLVNGVYGRLWRFSWLDQDCLHYVQMSGLLQEGLRAGRNNQSWLTFSQLTAAPEAAEEAAGWYDQVRYLMSGVMMSTLGQSALKAYRAETQRSLVLAAIGIRRYQRQTGGLPPDLKSLAPHFLERAPVDYMDGQPVRYRPGTNGAFLLYSVWEDGKDDGGDARPLRDERPVRFFNGRDLVWPMPASAEEIAEFKTRK